MGEEERVRKLHRWSSSELENEIRAFRDGEGRDRVRF